MTTLHHPLEPWIPGIAECILFASGSQLILGKPRDIRMGGFGSGKRHYFQDRVTLYDLLQLDVRRMAKQGLFRTGSAFTWHWMQNNAAIAFIEIRCGVDQILLWNLRRPSETSRDGAMLAIQVDWTTCHFGGKRPWLLCPVPGCGRRAAVLYLQDGFRCRGCLRLPYPSQYETAFDRALRRASRIQKLLGVEAWGGFPLALVKPRGMHWKTYLRLEEEHARLMAVHAQERDHQMQAILHWLDGRSARSKKVFPSSGHRRAKRPAVLA